MDSPSRSSAVVAIVDDDPWVRELVVDHLELHGFSCRCHATGESFLLSPDLPAVSCVVLDAHLPDLDGLEILRRLRAARPECPVIFYTGQIDPRFEERARQDGAADYVEKTSSVSSLIAAIQRAITSG